MRTLGITAILLVLLVCVCLGGWYLFSNRTVVSTADPATPATVTPPAPTVVPAPTVATAPTPAMNPQVAALLDELQRTQKFLNDTLAGPNPNQVLINELNGQISNIQFKINSLQNPVILPQPQIFIENPNQMNRAILETGRDQVVSYSLKSEDAYKAEVYTQANARQEQLTELGAQLKAQREYSNAHLDLLREENAQGRRFMEDLLREKKEEESRRLQAEEIPPPTTDKTTQSQYQNVYVYGASTVKSNSSTQPATTTIYPRRICQPRR